MKATRKEKLKISKETIRRMTPKAGEFGFMCSTINTEEMLNVFKAKTSRMEDVEIFGE